MALGIERQGDVADLGPGVGIGKKGFVAPGHPLDGPAQPLGGPADQPVFGIKVALGAEAAADVGGNHPEPVGLDAQHLLGQTGAYAHHVLAREVQRIAAAGGVVIADGAARLQRAACDALVLQPDPNHLVGGGQRGIDGGSVAVLVIEAEVAGNFGPDLRCPGLERRLGIRAGGQGLVVDGHQLGRVARAGQALGHHQGHRIADAARHFGHQHRPFGDVGGAAVAVDLGRDRDDAAEPVGRRLGARQNRQYAGLGQRLGVFDGADAGVGVGRAHDPAVGLMGQRDVVEEAALAAQKPWILEPGDRLADAEFHGFGFP